MRDVSVFLKDRQDAAGTKRVSIMAEDCDAYGQVLNSQAGAWFGITVRVRLNPILSNVCAAVLRFTRLKNGS